MNQLLCGVIAILLVLQGISSQVSEEENRKLRERICNDPFHSFLCQTVDPTKRKRYNTKPPQSGGNLLGDNSFPQPSRLLPPQVTAPPTTKKPEVTTRKPAQKTTPKPAQNLIPAQSALFANNLLPQAAQNDPVILKPKSEDDLCKHSFHSFLCNPGKNNKRRLYNGQKPGSPPPNSNALNGENSFLLSTQLRPDPPKVVPEPKLEPENSNDSPVFQGPGYLPPLDEKSEPSLFGDNSFLDPSLLLPTTQKPAPTTPKATTPRPTSRATTPRPTTPKPTTPRPTTPRPTTPRPTTPRPTTRRPITTTEPNLESAGAQNSGAQLLPEKPKEDLCAHSFHSFLCDKPAQSKRRRIYNGQKSSPENTNILGENSFLQPSRILPPTTAAPKTTAKPLRTTAVYSPVTRRTTTPKASSNLIGDNSFLSPTNLLPPTPKKPVVIPTTPKPTPKPVPVRPDPEVQPDAAQSPSVRLRPDASGKDEDLCKHSFHSFLCNGGKSGGKRRVYNGQNSNIVGANSFLDSQKLLPPKVRTTTYKPLFEEGSFKQSTNLKPELLNTAANTYLPPASYLPPQSRRSLRPDPNNYEFIGANSNVEITEVLPPPTSKSLPASLARGNPPTTTHAPHTTEAELQSAAAEEAPSVVVPQPDHHAHPPGGDHHHHDDAHAHGDHHGAAAHGHGDHHGAGTHGHGDHHHGAHGDHHHHHLDNITLEQLCRDPFHAFLCENVDTSKRRVYDGNPAQGTVSARERLQGLQGSSSNAQSTQVDPPRNNLSPNSLANSFSKPVQQRFSALPDPHGPNPVTLAPRPAQLPRVTPVATKLPLPYSSPVTVAAYVATTPRSFVIKDSHQPENNNDNNENLSLFIRKDNPLFQRLNLESVEPQRRVDDFNSRDVTPPQVPGAHLLRQPAQRLPVHRQRESTPDASAQQVGNRGRRPLRRKARPQTEDSDANASQEQFRFRENTPSRSSENVNRRHDVVEAHEERPQRIKFGERLPRRKRLNTNEADASVDTPTNPAGFVRGPRGVASSLAASTPDVQCKEPFSAYQCGSSTFREKREAKRKEDKEDKEERRDTEGEESEEKEGKREMRGRGRGHMRDQAQGQISDSGNGKHKEKHRTKVSVTTEKAPEKEQVDDEEEEEVKDVIERVGDPEDKSKTTTEDPRVVYQREIDEELKRREEDEKNRKDELKRRADELEKRKEELTRRDKEQEGRKAEEKRRKVEAERRKVEERIRKDMLKKLKEEQKHDDDDDDDDEKSSEDDEEKEEVEDEAKKAADYQKSVVAELKRREEEVTRREIELKRREDELKRREEDGKQKEAEIQRRKVQEKLNAEEMVRRDEEKVRIAEEMKRREEEDDRRAAAKEKLEAAKANN